MVNAWEFLIGFYGIFDDFLGFAGELGETLGKKDLEGDLVGYPFRRRLEIYGLSYFWGCDGKT